MASGDEDWGGRRRDIAYAQPVHLILSSCLAASRVHPGGLTKVALLALNAYAIIVSAQTHVTLRPTRLATSDDAPENVTFSK